MSTEITNINSSSFNQLAEAMGMNADAKTKKQGSTLARLKIDHSGVIGETTIKGKVKRVEVVDAGSYVLTLPDSETKIYQRNPKIRLFSQKFMYKKYVSSGGPEGKGMFVKTEMANDLKGDLRDNVGTFNCGKPSGWIDDYNALPQEQKDLIKSIKRVRVLFGEATFDSPLDDKGQELSPKESTPFIWEVDNRDAFKRLGVPIAQMVKQNRILPQSFINLDTEEKQISTGAKFYLPTVSLNPKEIKLNEKDQETFSGFTDWISSYNDWVVGSFNDASKNTVTDKDTIDEFVDVSEVAA